MAMSAPSAAPPHHLKIWASGPDIYVEIPGRLGPYITRYSYDTRGLNLILDLIGAHRIDTDFSLPPVPEAYRSNFTNGPGTPEQQASADKALRMAGLLK